MAGGAMLVELDWFVKHVRRRLDRCTWRCICQLQALVTFQFDISRMAIAACQLNELISVNTILIESAKSFWQHVKLLGIGAARRLRLPWSHMLNVAEANGARIRFFQRSEIRMPIFLGEIIYRIFSTATASRRLDRNRCDVRMASRAIAVCNIDETSIEAQVFAVAGTATLRLQNAW